MDSPLFTQADFDAVFSSENFEWLAEPEDTGNDLFDSVNSIPKLLPEFDKSNDSNDNNIPSENQVGYVPHFDYTGTPVSAPPEYMENSGPSLQEQIQAPSMHPPQQDFFTPPWNGCEDAQAKLSVESESEDEIVIVGQRKRKVVDEVEEPDTRTENAGNAQSQSVAPAPKKGKVQPRSTTSFRGRQKITRPLRPSLSPRQGNPHPASVQYGQVLADYQMGPQMYCPNPTGYATAPSNAATNPSSMVSGYPMPYLQNTGANGMMGSGNPSPRVQRIFSPERPPPKGVVRGPSGRELGYWVIQSPEPLPSDPHPPALGSMAYGYPAPPVVPNVGYGLPPPPSDAGSMANGFSVPPVATHMDSGLLPPGAYPNYMAYGSLAPPVAINMGYGLPPAPLAVGSMGNGFPVPLVATNMSTGILPPGLYPDHMAYSSPAPTLSTNMGNMGNGLVPSGPPPGCPDHMPYVGADGKIVGPRRPLNTLRSQSTQSTPAMLPVDRKWIAEMGSRRGSGVQDGRRKYSF